MVNTLRIGSLIKRYIKMRGKTAKEVAEALGMNYKTFCGILNRDVIDAEMLFKLANYLDIDLQWMSELFDHRKPISPFAPYQMSRMQSDFRKHDYPLVSHHLDECILNNPGSISEARKELLRIYPNLFYVLDVLMPEDDIIRITVIRGQEKLHCTPFPRNQTGGFPRRGRSLPNTYDGKEMLDQIIARRKEELF